MKRRVLRLAVALMAVMLFAAVLFVSASAETVTGSYPAGHIEWSLDEDGVLTITPLDAMRNGVIYLCEYKEDGSNTFVNFSKNNEAIKSIVIKNKTGLEIQTISGGIGEMPNCESITLPSTVTMITSRGGGWTFSRMASLKTLGREGEIKEGVVDISWYSKAAGVTADGDRYFYNCSSMESVLLPEAGFYSGVESFKNCVSLKSIVFPAQKTWFQIADDAFSGCTALETVTFMREPDKMSTSVNIFGDAEDLKYVEVAGAYTSVLEMCNNFDIPVRYIGADSDITVYTEYNTEWTINTATGVVTVHVTADNTDGNARLDDWSGAVWKAFLAEYKDTMTEIRFENVAGRTPIMRLGGRISGSTSLTKIVYPDTVTTIDANAGGWMYQNNTALRTFGPEGTPEGTCDMSKVTKLGNTRNMFTGAKFYKVIFPNELVGPDYIFLGGTEFKDCVNLKEIVIPAYVKQIGGEIFGGCSSLEKIIFLGTMIDKIDYITAATFAGCSEDLVIYGPIDSGTDANGIIGIANTYNIPFRYHNGEGNPLFTYPEGCIEWTVDLKGVVTVYPTSENNTGVADFHDPYSKEEKNEWKTFLSDYKDIVTKVVIENVPGRTDITTLNGSIYFTNLTSITFPDTVKYIKGRGDGGYCYNNDKLATFGPVGTPEGTCDLSGMDMSYDTLDRTTGYMGTAWEYQNGYVYRYLFQNADFTKVIFPEKMFSVVEAMFKNCDKLTEITLPASLRYIYTKGFIGCTSLTTVNILGDPWIASDAFDGCDILYEMNAQPGSYAAAFAEAKGLSCETPAGAVSPFGSAGKGVNWTFDLVSGDLVISGTGDVSELNDFVRYLAHVKTVAVGEGITSIGEDVFTGLNELQSIYMYSTLIPTIPEEASDVVVYCGLNYSMIDFFEENDIDYVVLDTIIYKYNIVFKDFNGTKLSSAVYNSGSTVEEPADPTREADKIYTYSFAGWDSELLPAGGDATYTATYTPTYIDYTIVFKNCDGSIISSKTYHYGDTVELPEDPLKPGDKVGRYKFISWGKEVPKTCEGSAEYTATFEAKYIAGDPNKDGKVDAKDAVLLAQYLAQWDVSLDMSAADCNSDGNVDAKDAVLLAQYLAQWNVTLG